MKKRSNKSFLASAAYLVVALVLCAGVIFYTGNGGTGLTVADITDTMPETDRKSTRLNSSHRCTSRMPSSA